MVTHPTMESWPRRRYRYLRKAEARPAWRSIPSGPLLPCAAWQGAWRRDLSGAASTSTAHRTAFGKPRSRRNFAYTREHREMGNRPTPSAGAADTLENARSRVSASRFLRSRGARARIAPHRHLSGSSGFRVGKGVLGLHQAPPQASMVPLCAISNCTKSSWDLRRRGESRQWRYKKPQGIRRWVRLRCAWGGRQTCRYTALSVRPWSPVTIPVRDAGAISTTPWKTFIEADVPRVNCLKCGVKQIPVAWAEDGSRFTELFEAYAIQVLQAVRSKVQAQWLTALSWDLSRPGHGPCGPQCGTGGHTRRGAAITGRVALAVHARRCRPR